MTRIAIIDHETHTLYIEDVSDETLAKYNYEEEEYIKDNYCGLANYSWDYITSAQYIPKDTDQEVYDINFKDLI